MSLKGRLLPKLLSAIPMFECFDHVLMQLFSTAKAILLIITNFYGKKYKGSNNY